MSRRTRVFVELWPWLLSIAVCAPLLGSRGYVLSYDMVWVPDLALDRDSWGLGTALPRAVPSDAVVALVDEMLPGDIVQKLILVGSLGLAGMGAARASLDRGAAAAVAAAGIYVWNPFVAERLVLGHWPLLAGYAALPWIVVAGRRLRADDRSAWPALTVGLAASALSAVGGVLGLLVALATQAGSDAATRWRRLGLLVAVSAAVNAPWWVAGVAYPGGATTDPDAVERFAVEPEGMLGRLGALLSLGGVWNAEVVPDSRDTPIAVLSLVTIGAVVIVGWRRWLATERAEAAAFIGLGMLAVGVGLAGWVAPDAVAWTVSHVPGLGLLRDGTRFLPLLAVGQSIAFGWAVGLAATRLRRPVATFLAVLAAVWPLALLPDLAWGAGGTLDPVAYPDDWVESRRVVDELDIDGDLLVLPFAAYRAPDWNDGHPVLDPAGRYFADTVVDDDLVVTGELLEGEDPRAAAVDAVLADMPGPEELASELGRLGIGAVVYDSSAGPPGMPLDGLDEVWASGELTISTVPGPVASPPEPAAGRVVAVGLAWLVAAMTTAGGLALALRRRVRPDAPVGW
jgi:hypothetical protein